MQIYRCPDMLFLYFIGQTGAAMSHIREVDKCSFFFGSTHRIGTQFTVSSAITNT